MNLTVPKFALVSHVLPPSASGQAIVLSRLLRDFEPQSYCLISTNNNDTILNSAVTDRLPAKYYTLPKENAHRVSPILRAIKNRLFTKSNNDRHSESHENATNSNAIGHDRRLLKRTVNHALYLEDRLCLRREMYRRAARIRQIVASENCQVVIACSGDLLDLPAACVAARWSNAAFVPYLFDDHAMNSAPGFHREFAQETMRWMIRQAAAVIVPNVFLAQEYRSRYRIDAIVIPNPIESSPLLPPTPRPMSNPVRLVYTGAIYEAHFDAIERILHAVRSLGAAFELHLYTSTNKRHLLNHNIVSPAIIHPSMPVAEALAQQQCADILLLPLAFDSSIPETIRTSAPGKMGELLASGRPILVHAPPDSFVTWYFRQKGCGAVVVERNPAMLKEAINRIRSDVEYCNGIIRRAHRCALRDFSLPIAQARLFEVLQSIEQPDSAALRLSAPGFDPSQSSKAG